MDEIINWMGGWPKEGLMSAAEWESRLNAAGRAGGGRAVRPAGAGERALRERLAAEPLLVAPGADAGRLALTPGADAAIERLARLYLAPGDAVLVERPTSRAALQAFRRAGAVPRETASDAGGMLPEELLRSLARLKPRLVYAAPLGTDPEGRVWSGERRQALLRICAEAGVPVLLDERQALLRDEAESPPPKTLQAADAEAPGAVWAVGELPPGLIAGARFGWLVRRGTGDGDGWGLPNGGRDEADRAFAFAEPPPPEEQRAVLALLEGGELEPLLLAMRFVCRTRLGSLAEQLERRKLPGVSWSEPQAGMHLWLRLPEGLEAEALLRAAWLNGLLFQPGAGFYAEAPERSRLRLTPAHADERQLRAGVARLAETIGEFLGRWE